MTPYNKVPRVKSKFTFKNRWSVSGQSRAMRAIMHPLEFGE